MGRNCLFMSWFGSIHGIRAVDPHSFFADPDPAVFLMRIRIDNTDIFVLRARNHIWNFFAFSNYGSSVATPHHGDPDPILNVREKWVPDSAIRMTMDPQHNFLNYQLKQKLCCGSAWIRNFCLDPELLFRIWIQQKIKKQIYKYFIYHFWHVDSGLRW